MVVITADDARRIQQATKAKRLVPDPQFTPGMAMYAVGIDREKASSLDFCEKFYRTMEFFNHTFDTPSFDSGEEKKFARFVDFWSIIERLPWKNTKQVKAGMRLVGYDDQEVDQKTTQRLYQKCLRRSKLIDKEKSVDPLVHPAGINQTWLAPDAGTVPTVPLSIETTCVDTPTSTAASSAVSCLSFGTPMVLCGTDDDRRAESEAILPWYVDKDGETFPLIEISDDEETEVASDIISIASRMTSMSGTKAGTKSLDRLDAMLVGKQFRKSSTLAHHERQLKQKMRDNRKAAFKVGSTLYKSVADGEVTLAKLASAEKVATTVNAIFGSQHLTGNALIEAVKHDRVGKSPLKRGCPGRLSDEDFESLATLIFTMGSIDQANCDKPKSRPELRSLLDLIVNTKMREDSANQVDPMHLYRRIQQHNSLEQDMSGLQPREKRRVLWLTYQNQEKNYEKWEEVALENDWARLPVNDEEKEQEGHVIFYEEQLGNIINYDEMKFSLCGKAQQRSGRPAMAPLNNNLPKAGFSDDKSSKDCTICVAFNFKDEVLPLLFILPSTAKPENQRVKYSFFKGMHQHKGVFGMDREHYADPEVAFSKKGSMTKTIHRDFHKKLIHPLYPKAQDAKGHRICTKSDSGPGRNDDEFLFDCKAVGHLHFAGLPNGTEVGQECDQAFGPFKSILEENRDRLYQAKQRTNSGDTAWADLGYIVYGGVVPLLNGETVSLRNAVTEGLTPSNLRSAREKCGYCPATRAALRSDKVRHEIIEASAGIVDEDADPMGLLLEQIEHDNHATVASLVANGFAQAIKGRRVMKRVTANAVTGREANETLPGSRERQDLLADCSTAGQFFRITNGGGCTNQTDALIGKARLRMKEAAKEMAKRRDGADDWLEYELAGTAVIEKYGAAAYKNWRKDDLRSVMEWMNGPNPSKEDKLPPRSVNKTQLVQLYEGKFKAKVDRGDVPVGGWSPDDEEEFQRLTAGDISNLDECGLMKEAFDRESESLATRLSVLPIDRVKEVICEIDIGILKTIIDEMSNGSGGGNSSDSGSNDNDERSDELGSSDDHEEADNDSVEGDSSEE